MLSKPDKERYEATILEVVRRMKAREVTDNYALAAAFNRTYNWPCHIRAAILKRGLMTPEEWTACFTQRHKKKVRWSCPQCGSRAKRIPTGEPIPTKKVHQPTKEEHTNGRAKRETKPTLSKPVAYEHTKNLKVNPDEKGRFNLSSL